MSSSIRNGPGPSGVRELSLHGAPAGVQAGPAKPRRPTRYLSGSIVLAAYGLGPYAPLVLRRGRHSFSWAFASTIAALIWAGTIWKWEWVRSAVENGIFPLVPWMFGLAVAALLWILAACRALWLAGADPRFVPERLPRWMREPWVCGLLGIVLPGFGHLASGHPRRAAFAGWNAAALILSALFLWHAAWMWRCNHNAGAAAIPGMALEVLFLFVVIVATVASLGWIGAGLDGARLLSQRLGRSGPVRGDAVTLALLVTLVLALFTVHPVAVARDLDAFASLFRAQGYRLAPLCLESLAMQFDRAEPRYVMVTAELLDGMGRHEKASALRGELRQRWESYAEHLMREELYLGDSLVPPFLDMEGDPLMDLPGAEPMEEFETSPEDSLLVPRTTGHDTLSMALPD